MLNMKRLEEINWRDNSEIIKNQILEIIENVEKEAFIEGYKYAITILENGIVKKEKTD